jgi:hypothetical protein
VVRWLSIGLVPQTGVIVGLATAAAQIPAFHGASELMLDVIPGTTLRYGRTLPSPCGTPLAGRENQVPGGTAHGGGRWIERRRVSYKATI